jgi:putative membrane protein
MNNDQFPMPYPRGGGGGQMFVEHAGNAGGWPDGLSWVMFALLLLLFLIAVASLAFALYDRSHRGAASAPSGALGELELRYARGELERDEYLQRRADLGGAAAPPSEATTVVVPPPEPQPT